MLKPLSSVAAQNFSDLARLRLACIWLQPAGFALALVLGSLYCLLSIGALRSTWPTVPVGAVVGTSAVLLTMFSLLVAWSRVGAKDPLGRARERLSQSGLDQHLPRLLDEQFQAELAETIARRMPMARQWACGRNTLEGRLELLARCYPQLRQRELHAERLTSPDCLLILLQHTVAGLRRLFGPDFSACLSLLVVLAVLAIVVALGISVAGPLILLGWSISLMTLPAELQSALVLSHVLENWRPLDSPAGPAS